MALPTSQEVERKRDAVAAYVADAENKLAVFDDMAAKIELLTGIINDLFLYKRMHIDREKGYVFTSHIRQEIHPGDLSSGEQHQLVLLYELLFQTKPGSLVLIDEPEISLHVAWQERFLDDLMRMAKLSKFDVLVATHSAEIIGEYWDLAVGLRGPDQDTDDTVQENVS
jgi:predicted ATP-binding protein involved in virulence